MASRDRARIGYVDVVVTFSILVSFIAVYPWVSDFITLAQGPADPLTTALLNIAPAVLLISLLVSIGVSAR